MTTRSIAGVLFALVFLVGCAGNEDSEQSTVPTATSDNDVTERESPELKIEPDSLDEAGKKFKNLTQDTEDMVHWAAIATALEFSWIDYRNEQARIANVDPRRVNDAANHQEIVSLINKELEKLSPEQKHDALAVWSYHNTDPALRINVDKIKSDIFLKAAKLFAQQLAR